MAKRKPLSKTLRFEVFKRDGFTCQYCGRMAPDVILEVDHINPVANGGENDILNLTTSCRDCNRGKGKRKLSDRDEVKKQQSQLKELEEKREQLEMMVQWKKELRNLDAQSVQAVEGYLQSETGYGFSEYGRTNMLKDIKQYGVAEVLEAAELSVMQYYDGTAESVTKVFNYVGRILNVRHRQQKDPRIKCANYIAAILRNKGCYCNRAKIESLIEHVPEEEHETAVKIAKYASSWTAFVYQMERWENGQYGV